MTYAPSPHPDIIAMHCKEGRKRRIAPCGPGGIRTRPAMRPTKHMQAARPPGGTCIAHCRIAHKARGRRGAGRARGAAVARAAHAAACDGLLREQRRGPRGGRLGRGWARVRGGAGCWEREAPSLRGATRHAGRCGAVHTVPLGRSADRPLPARRAGGGAGSRPSGARAGGTPGSTTQGGEWGAGFEFRHTCREGSPAVAGARGEGGGLAGTGRGVPCSEARRRRRRRWPGR